MMPGTENAATITFDENDDKKVAEELKEEDKSTDPTEDADDSEEDIDPEAKVGKEGEDSKEDDSDEGTGEEEESIEDVRAKLKKAEEERDNYKEATLISKKKDRELTEQKDLSDEEKKELGDDGVKKIEQARKTEKEAISSFLDDNKDYVDDKSWGDLMSHYVAPAEPTSDNISKALDAAHILKLREEGNLMTAEEAQKQAAKAQVKTQERNLASSKGNGGTGSRKKTPSNQGAAKMSERFKHSNAKDVAKMDDSNEQVIDITKQ